MPHVDHQQLERFAVELLAAGGISREEAEVVGGSLVASNLRGYESHGVMRIPFYLDMLEKGEAVSGAELAIENESPTLMVANANWGLGRVQTGRLLDRLIQKARVGGSAIGTLYQASHIGRLGEYCELAAEQGMVLMMMVNNHGAVHRVAPPGGRASRLGTNPIAIGIPHGEEPLILDISTSATAEGKVRVKHIAGQSCPEGWLIDNQGRPSTDPGDLYSDPPGAILPLGGEQAYKGFGLALMIDIFAGAFSGGLCSRETPKTQKGNCVFAMCLDAEHFAGKEHFAREVAEIAGFVRSCPTADGCRKVMLPGDPERNVMAERLDTGIFFDDENWAKLTSLAQRLAVAPPS